MLCLGFSQAAGVGRVAYCDQAVLVVFASAVAAAAVVLAVSVFFDLAIAHSS